MFCPFILWYSVIPRLLVVEYPCRWVYKNVLFCGNHELIRLLFPRNIYYWIEQFVHDWYCYTHNHHNSINTANKTVSNKTCNCEIARKEHTHMSLTAILEGKPGRTPLILPLQTSSLTPSQHVLLRQDKAQQWKKRSAGGKRALVQRW